MKQADLLDPEKLEERMREIDSKAQHDLKFLSKRTHYRARLSEISQTIKNLRLEERAIKDALRGASNRRFSDNLIKGTKIIPKENESN